jgi:hypothetical protein
VENPSSVHFTEHEQKSSELTMMVQNAGAKYDAAKEELEKAMKSEITAANLHFYQKMVVVRIPAFSALPIIL